MAVVRQEGAEVAQRQAAVVGAVVPRQEQTGEPGERRMVQQVLNGVVRPQVRAGRDMGRCDE